MEFRHLEIDREKGIIKIDGTPIPKNATKLKLLIDGSICEPEITLGYSGAKRNREGSGTEV